MLRVGECKSLARQNLSGRYGTVIGAQFIVSLVLLIVVILMSASLGAAVYFGNVFHNFTAPDFTFMAIGAVSFTAFLFIYIILHVFFSYGQIRLMLNLLRGKKYGVGDIFHAFKRGSHPWRIMLIQIIRSGVVMVLGLISRGLQFTFESGITANAAGSSTTFLAGVATVRLVFVIFSVIVAIETYLCLIVAVDMPNAGIWECFKQSARLMRGRQLKGLWLIYFSFLLWGILCLILPIAVLWTAPYMLATQIIFYMDAGETLWQLPGSRAAQKARQQRTAETAATETAAEAPTSGAAANEATAAEATAAEAEATASEAAGAEENRTDSDIAHNSSTDTEQHEGEET